MKLNIREKTLFITVGAIFLFLLGVTLQGVALKAQKIDYESRLEILYQKSFYDTNHAMRNLEVRMSKMGAVYDKDSQTVLLSDIWRQGTDLQTNLSQLPSSLGPMEYTMRFVNQLSDYCRSLNKKLAQGGELSAEEEKQLRLMYNELKNLNAQLQKVGQDFAEGKLSWMVMFNENPQPEYQKVVQTFEQMESTSSEYPSLIYDGPFSEALQKMKLLGLPVQEVDAKTAEKNAKDFLNFMPLKSLKSTGEIKGKMPAFGFDYVATSGQMGSLEVSKRGGKVIWMTGDGDNGDLTVEACEAKAAEFLKKKGFENMKAAYEQHDQSSVIVNFTAMQNNIIVYPDLVKVKISRKDGRVLGFEAINYYNCHTPRNAVSPTLSQAEAKAKVNPALTVQVERLAIIPLDNGDEVLCWEFTAERDGEIFVVYINAQNGREEQVFKIINSDEGSMVL